MGIDPTCAGIRALGHSWWPSPHWWMSLTAADQGAWVSGIGAFAAAGVALWLGFSQHRKDKRETREIRLAIANALIADLRTAEAFFRSQVDQWKGAKRTSDAALRCVNQVSCISLPSFDSFNGLLPRLGSEVAAPVIDAYGRILRVTSLAKGQKASDRKIADDILFVEELLKGTPNVLAGIAYAENALKPYIVVPKPLDNPQQR